jgi:hypothetical protein
MYFVYILVKKYNILDTIHVTVVGSIDSVLNNFSLI